MTTNQIVIKNWIESHGFEAQFQDKGVVVYIPVYKSQRYSQLEFAGYEASYVETQHQARHALGY